MRVSAYRKLKLAPAWVTEQLEQRGFVISVGVGLSGMTHMCAKRM